MHIATCSAAVSNGADSLVWFADVSTGKTRAVTSTQQTQAGSLNSKHRYFYSWVEIFVLQVFFKCQSDL